MTVFDRIASAVFDLGQAFKVLVPAMAELNERDLDALNPNREPGAGPPPAMVDEDGVPLRLVPDPTASAACRPVPKMKLRKDLEAQAVIVERAAKRIRGIVEGLAPKAGAVKPPDDVPCSSCDRIGKWAIAYRGDKCRACYDWWLEWHELPPLNIVEKLHRGERLTTKDRRQAELERDRRLKAGKAQAAAMAVHAVRTKKGDARR